MSKITDQEMLDVVEAIRLAESYAEGSGDYFKGYVTAKGVDVGSLALSFLNVVRRDTIEEFDKKVMDKTLDKLIKLYQDGVFDKFKGE